MSIIDFENQFNDLVTETLSDVPKEELKEYFGDTLLVDEILRILDSVFSDEELEEILKKARVGK